MAFETTQAHRDIFAAVDARDRHLMIRARAGVGKTSTLVQALDRIHPSESVIFLVFAKRNAADIRAKAPPHVEVRTLNSLGMGALMSQIRGLVVDENKTRRIAQELNKIDSGDDLAVGGMLSAILAAEAQTPAGRVLRRASRDALSVPALITPACKLVGYAKSAGILPAGVFSVDGLIADEPEEWDILLARHDVEIPDRVSRPDVIEAARHILRRSCQVTRVIDYDDQLLLTYALGAPVPTYDWVFNDESQDDSPLQHALIKRCIKPVTGRLVAVGDDAQAIFAWRGADAESMSTMQREYNCLELPLTVSYRCPKSVIREAQKYVADIQSHPSAVDGTVDYSGLPVETVSMGAGDMVICRFSAPTVRAAFSLLKRGIPATVMGRDIGKGLRALIKQLTATDMPDLLSRLQEWEAKQKASAGDDEAKLASISDKAETLRVFAEMVPDLDALGVKIDAMFADKDPASVVTCSTIHKAKGLEADRVFVIDHDKPCKWAKQPWQIQQETNLKYVAVTRAKRHLQFVSSGAQQAVRTEPLPPPRPWVALTGDTYPVRKDLQQMGALFNTSEHPGVWSIHPSRADTAQALVPAKREREFSDNAAVRRIQNKRRYR